MKIWSETYAKTVALLKLGVALMLLRTETMSWTHYFRSWEPKDTGLWNICKNFLWKMEKLLFIYNANFLFDNTYFIFITGNHGGLQQELYDHLRCLPEHISYLGIGRIPLSGIADFISQHCCYFQYHFLESWSTLSALFLIFNFSFP